MESAMNGNTSGKLGLGEVRFGFDQDSARDKAKFLRGGGQSANEPQHYQGPKTTSARGTRMRDTMTGEGSVGERSLAQHAGSVLAVAKLEVCQWETPRGQPREVPGVSKKW